MAAVGFQVFCRPEKLDFSPSVAYNRGERQRTEKYLCEDRQRGRATGCKRVWDETGGSASGSFKAEARA